MKVTTPADVAPASGNEFAGETTLNRAFASAHVAVDRAAGAADDVTHKIKPAIDRVAEAAHETVDRVAGVAAPTAAWLSGKADSLKASQRTLADDAGRYVSAHPWKSIGIALAAGFFLSRIIR
jgi:ElaB/YqjD/DUF883 family membrane-anchored ribosome-binding protein